MSTTEPIEGQLTVDQLLTEKASNPPENNDTPLAAPLPDANDTVNGNPKTAEASKLGAGVPVRCAVGTPARRPAAADGRTVSIRVSLSAEEHAALRSRAQTERVAMSRLLVESTLDEQAAGRRVDGARVTELLELRRLLGNATGNLNQLAHAANMAGRLVAEEQLVTVLAEVRELNRRIGAELR